MKIKEIKVVLEQVNDPNDQLLIDLKQDSRKGVQKLVAQKLRHLKQHQEKLNDFERRLSYEKQYWQGQIENVAGVDEVGRGPLAGPVVTCAVILPHDFSLIDVNDSKQLSPQKRSKLYYQILDQAVAVSIGVSSSQKIDKENIYHATELAMADAVKNLKVRPDSLLVDAMHIDTDIPQTKLFHGDAKSVTVGAASIVAKVYRDHLMDQYAEIYPEYDFKHNAGYGTKKHLAALVKYGATPIHRRSFNPVAKLTFK